MKYNDIKNIQLKPYISGNGMVFRFPAIVKAKLGITTDSLFDVKTTKNKISLTVVD